MRGDRAEEMAKEAGQAAHRLERPPVADQVHVVLWVIKANDIRFVTDQYMDKFDFVRQMLNKEGESLDRSFFSFLACFTDEIQRLISVDNAHIVHSNNIKS